MSIVDQHGEAVVTLDGVWTAMFKIFLVLLPLVFALLFTWGCWVTMGLVEMKYEIQGISKELSQLASTTKKP